MQKLDKETIRLSESLDIPDLDGLPGSMVGNPEAANKMTIPLCTHTLAHCDVIENGGARKEAEGTLYSCDLADAEYSVF